MQALTTFQGIDLHDQWNAQSDALRQKTIALWRRNAILPPNENAEDRARQIALVADEAHRCAGKADAGFATILDANKIRASKRLFTTATPRYFGKAIKDAAEANDLAVVGMDDEAVFGPVIHKLTFGQAIEQELLTDYQVVIVGVDEPMVREWIENYEIASTDLVLSRLRSGLSIP